MTHFPGAISEPGCSNGQVYSPPEVKPVGSRCSTRNIEVSQESDFNAFKDLELA